MITTDPTTGLEQHLATLLRGMASREGLEAARESYEDAPYDILFKAAAYIEQIERQMESREWKEGEAFFIELRTGCSCCTEENEWYGPIFNEEEALARMYEFEQRKAKSSQYYSRGLYGLYKVSGKIRTLVDEDGEVTRQFLDEDERDIIYKQPGYFSTAPYGTFRYSVGTMDRRN